MPDPKVHFSRRAVVRSAAALAAAGLLDRSHPATAPASVAAQEATPLAVVDPRLREAVAAIDLAIGQLMARDGTPGAALAVTDRDGVLFSREYGYADLGTKTPVHPETVFEFGSIGKTFTAVGVLQLADEGTIDLHAPVDLYLPWFAVQSDYPPITAHDLLSHTSGLIFGTDFTPSPKAEIWALREIGVAGPPGAAFLYSNVGYKTLGLLLEALTGKPYRDVVQERIFDPLGMTAAANAITSEVRKRLAVGYAPWFDDRPPVPSAGLVVAPWVETSSGDGSMAASAIELTAFMRMLLNGGAGPNGQLLSEAGFALMRQPYAKSIPLLPETDYGYGLMISSLDGEPLIGHGGSMLGYLSALFGLPESGLGAVVQVNGPGDRIGMVRFALQAVVVALRDEPLPSLPIADPAAIENAADYAGTYAGDAGTVRLEPRGTGLELVVGDERVALLAQGTDTFVANKSDLALFLLRVGRDASGEVVELTYGPDWYRGERYAGPTTFEVPEEWGAFPGHYRSHNPWNSNVRVGVRKDQLWLFWPDGREEVLELTASGFRPSADPTTPLRLTFDTVVDGAALRARWNFGDEAYTRFFTP